MRPEIIGILSKMTDESVMSAWIKRLSFEGVSDFLDYVELLDRPHRDRWIEVYDKTFAFI